MTTPSTRTAQVLAVLGGLALIVSAFLPWTADGRVALDLGVGASGRAAPTLALLLIAVAAAGALAGLVGARGRLHAGVGAAAAVTVLCWMALGAGVALTAGIWVATGAATLLFLAAALRAP